MAKSKVMLESTDHLKPRILALIIAGIMLMAAVGILFWTGADLTSIDLKGALLGGQVTAVTVLIAGLASGMFFLPVPAELAFILGLQQGVNPWLAVLAVLGGFVTGHVISYLIGLKLSRIVRYFISPKKLYGLRRKVNRWGAYAIFLFNLLPAPSPQLTFGLGIARYNVARLITLVVVGNTIKYVAIATFFILM